MKKDQDAGDALLRIFLESPIDPSLALVVSGTSRARLEEVRNSAPELMRVARQTDVGALSRQDTVLVATLVRNLRSLAELALREEWDNQAMIPQLQSLISDCDTLSDALPVLG